MKTVYKMHYLKTHLSELVDSINEDQQIVFGERGKPQYVISKYQPKAGKRRGYGLLKNQAAHKVAPDLGGWTQKDLKSFEDGSNQLFD
jgi:antitoxin (DNA-binding transcriptional repressor) of toxin-antitoxin stability system